MKADILCTLLAQRILPEQFQLWGLDVHWMAEEYNTPENMAIVEDVIANYETLAAEYQSCLNAVAYKTKRAAEYPPMEDYLDGIVKGDQAQIDKYIVDCLAVKEKYPKE